MMYALRRSIDNCNVLFAEIYSLCGLATARARGCICARACECVCVCACSVTTTIQVASLSTACAGLGWAGGWAVVLWCVPARWHACRRA